MNIHPQFNKTKRPYEPDNPLGNPNPWEHPNPNFYPPDNFMPRFNIDTKPDWTPDFSERIDIETSSVNLALTVLNMSKREYNSMSIQDLKKQRKQNFEITSHDALNILIYYKQDTGNFLQKLNPIKNKIIPHDFNTDS